MFFVKFVNLLGNCDCITYYGNSVMNMALSVTGHIIETKAKIFLNKDLANKKRC